MSRHSEFLARIREWTLQDPELIARYHAVRRWSFGVRASEYHLTNACNIRCKGCWFFVNDFDKQTREVTGLNDLKAFVARERERGVNAALLIGGEPTLFPDRISAYVEAMDYVTISSNGLQKLPREGFENVAVGISLFGGGRLDDELRAIKPNGKTFDGLFDTALKHYRNDERAGFVFATTEAGLDYIEETVAKIHDNGNQVAINFYSQYDTADPLGQADGQRLVDEILRVKLLYPETLISNEYFIRTVISGRSHWGKFGYDVCPSISEDHPAHDARRRNGAPTLPLFNAIAPDLTTTLFCCTSGSCGDCRDSQAIISWLMLNAIEFGESLASLRTWVEIAESYWRGFVWTPYHPSKVTAPVAPVRPREVGIAAPETAA